MLRRFISLIVWFAILTGTAGIARTVCVAAQDKAAQDKAAQDKAAQDKAAQDKAAQDKAAKDKAAKDKAAQDKAGKDKKVTPEKLTPDKAITAEGVAESAIYLNGTRDGMTQVRRTGVERGRISRLIADGKFEESTYERRFIRGENMNKDRIRIERTMPTAQYSLVFADGHVWGIINDAIFTPRQETTQDFLSREWHGIDTLLRYKENGSTLSLVGKDKQKGLDLFVLDVIDKEQRRTRFYISAKTARVLWLEYDEPAQPGIEAAKFLRKFHDYHLAQGTLVPFRSVLSKDGTQIEETQIFTITYGTKVDEAQFKNPEFPSSATASKP